MNFDVLQRGKNLNTKFDKIQRGNVPIQTQDLRMEKLITVDQEGRRRRNELNDSSEIYQNHQTKEKNAPNPHHFSSVSDQFDHATTNRREGENQSICENRNEVSKPPFDFKADNSNIIDIEKTEMMTCPDISDVQPVRAISKNTSTSSIQDIPSNANYLDVQNNYVNCDYAEDWECGECSFINTNATTQCENCTPQSIINTMPTLLKKNKTTTKSSKICTYCGVIVALNDVCDACAGSTTSEEWECTTCQFKNESHDEKCGNCDAVKSKPPSKTLDSQIWTERFKPTTIQELEQVIFKKRIQEIREWLKEAIQTPHASVLIISGGTGVGKTVTFHTVAKSMGLRVKEWISDFGWIGSDAGHEEHSFASFLSNSKYGLSSLKNYDGQPSSKFSVILVDGIPEFESTSSRKKFHEILRNVLSPREDTVPLPLVFIHSCHGDEPNPNYLKRLLSDEICDAAQMITLAPITAKKTQNVLRDISDVMGVQVTDKTIESIAVDAAGDLQRAINDLQALTIHSSLSKSKKRHQGSTQKTPESVAKTDIVTNRLSFLAGVRKLLRAKTKGQVAKAEAEKAEKAAQKRANNSKSRPTKKRKTLKSTNESSGEIEYDVLAPLDPNELVYDPEIVGSSCGLDPMTLVDFMQYNMVEFLTNPEGAENESDQVKFLECQRLAKAFDTLSFCDTIDTLGSCHGEYSKRYNQHQNTFPGSYLLTLGSTVVSANRTSWNRKGIPDVKGPKIYEMMRTVRDLKTVCIPINLTRGLGRKNAHEYHGTFQNGFVCRSQVVQEMQEIPFATNCNLDEEIDECGSSDYEM